MRPSILAAVLAVACFACGADDSPFSDAGLEPVDLHALSAALVSAGDPPANAPCLALEDAPPCEDGAVPIASGYDEHGCEMPPECALIHCEMTADCPSPFVCDEGLCSRPR